MVLVSRMEKQTPKKDNEMVQYLSVKSPLAGGSVDQCSISFKATMFTIVLILSRGLPIELIIRIMYHYKGIIHPVASMLKKIKMVHLYPQYTQDIYDSKVVGWDFPFPNAGNALYEIQDTSGRKGQKDIFKFIAEIYEPILDMEKISLDNEEVRDGCWATRSCIRPNTNPNVIIKPEYPVLKWDYENQKLVLINGIPRWDYLDDQ